MSMNFSFSLKIPNVDSELMQPKRTASKSIFSKRKPKNLNIACERMKINEKTDFQGRWQIEWMTKVQFYGFHYVYVLGHILIIERKSIRGIIIRLN